MDDIELNVYLVALIHEPNESTTTCTTSKMRQIKHIAFERPSTSSVLCLERLFKFWKAFVFISSSTRGTQRQGKQQKQPINATHS